MFRGGKVDSYGTGIASGLGTRSGYVRGGGVSYNPFNKTQTQSLIDAYTPRGIPQSAVDFFRANQANQRSSGRFRTMGPGTMLNEPELAYEEFPEISSEMPSGLTASADPDFIPKGGIEDLKTTANVELDLPTSKVEDLTTETEVEKVDTKDDEPEVTMTDLEKALGLDKARQEYAGDALAAASKAFFEGRGFEAIADAAAVKSKAPDIKRLAAIEEFKMKGAKDIAKLRAKNKTYAPGNAQKNYEFFVSQGIPKDEALNLSMKLSRNFDAAYLELENQGTVTAKKFDSLARARNIDPLPNVDIETLEVGDVYYIPGQKSLVSIVLKEGKKDLLQTKY